MSLLDGRPPLSPGPTRVRPHANLVVLRVVVLLLFALLAFRLADMQLVHGTDYAERSKENHLRVASVLPPRGLVTDRNGELLVDNVPVYAATLIPEFLPTDEDDRRTIYVWVEDALGVPALQVSEMVRFAEEEGLTGQALKVKDQLSNTEALLVEEASVRFPGLVLAVSAGRQYLAGSHFSHILGYIGPQTAEEYALLQQQDYQLNELVGKAGLESRYETELRGQPGALFTEADAMGRILTVLETTEPEPGLSLKLAIDAELQTFVAEILEASRGESPVASAVVMDANTGSVLALVSIPNYDNNLFGDPSRAGEFETLVTDPRRPLLNHTLTPSAPGSTFKLVTASAALEYGNITATTGRDVSSAVLEVKGENGVIYPMRDWRAHGPLELRSAIAWSSNIYFFMASCGIPDEPNADGLGKDVEEAAVRLGYYARSFGFGRATGIDLDAAEADGIVPTPEWKQRSRSGPEFNPEDRDWYYADTCFTGIGQGDVLATPLQIAAMTAAIANGGTLVQPHVVDEIVDSEGTVVETIAPAGVEVPVSPENLKVVREGMRESVSYGAGERANIDETVLVAGKTGTAEFGFRRDDGTFLEHGWFTGFAPYDDPEIVVTVYYELGVGGLKAAPVAGRIIEYYWENIRK